MFKKLILSLLSALLLLVSFAPVAHAQETWYNQSYPNWFTKVYSSATPPSEIFGERYTAAQVQWVIYALPTVIFAQNATVKDVAVCALTQNLASAECQASITKLWNLMHGIAQAEPNQNYAQNRQPSFVASLLADRPLSGITYTKQIARNFHLIPEVSAQGFGFTTALNPILGLWKAARNIAYALLVIAVVVLSFMIMFRVKIAPQVVISVQSALPKIAIALVLITFSYAIAGFIIDLMYVIIGLLSFLLTNSGLPITDTTAQMFTWFTVGPNNTGIFGAVFSYWWGFVGACFLAFEMLTGGGGPFAGIGGLIAILIIILLIFIALYVAVKLIWTLFKAFANVLISVIAGPLMIFLGVAVPGMGFGSWLKGYIANLAVFPITGILLKLAFLFLDQIYNIAKGAGYTFVDIGGQTGWPPLIGGGSSMTGVIFLSVSFVLFTMVPKATEIIQGFLSGRPYAYGTAIGEAMGTPRYAAGAGISGGGTWLAGRGLKPDETAGFWRQLLSQGSSAVGKSLTK